MVRVVVVHGAGHRVGILLQPGDRFQNGLLGVDAPQGNTACGKLATAALKRLVQGGLRLTEEPELAYDGRERRMYNVQKTDGASVADSLTRSGGVRVGRSVTWW